MQARNGRRQARNEEMTGEEWEIAGEVYLAPVRRCMTAVI
jgi:hypothetical protein